MSLILNKPIVSIDWLYSNLNDKDLIILDATIPKVTAKNDISVNEKMQIKNAVFFDIKNTFSDITAPFPNTVLSAKDFALKVRELGINNNSCILVYDDLGVYSSPRVWWLFQLMGFKNIAVLNGGLLEWKLKEYPLEKPKKVKYKIGDYTADYQPKKIKFTKDVLIALENEKILITDARSKGRFSATEPEPRKDVKGGHIPNSVSLPFSDIIKDGKFKNEEELKQIFSLKNPKKKDFIFSCGTGITAAIIALGAEISGYKNYAVYDGSWTEWGTTKDLPIEK